MAGARSFHDAAVVLLGHGAAAVAASAEPMLQQADALRASGRFGRVEPAFWKQAPHVNEVLPTLTHSRVFIVPMFATAGYFAGEIIPNNLGFPPLIDGRSCGLQSKANGATWFYTPPVGTHPAVTDLLLARGQAALSSSSPTARPHPWETALLLIGHGTGRSDRSRAGVEARAEELRSRGIFSEVHTAYLEERPRVDEWPRLIRRTSVVALPYLISDGLHGGEDVSILLGAEADEVRARLAAGRPAWSNPTSLHGRRVWLAGSLGGAPELAGLILELVREAAEEAGAPAG